MKKVILFDFDGVFIDSFPFILGILQRLHQEHGMPPITAEQLKELSEGNVWKNYEAFGVRGERKQIFQKAIVKAYLENQKDINFFLGMKQCVTEIAEDATLIIISSNFTAVIQQLLEREHMETYFREILGAEIEGHKEEKIQKFMRENGIQPQDMYLVTDTTGDILEVKSLGIHTIAVTWGFHESERFKKSNATAILHSP
ncbi:MAG: HAD hydrolase-like protein, partial [Candidatus Moraniibacteriota bacterium]